MNLRTLAITVVASLLFASAVFGQTVQVTGKITALTDTQITIQSGTDSWTIKRDATTKVTSGTLSVGQTVTLQCVSPDAQKKEDPAASPSPSAASE